MKNSRKKLAVFDIDETIFRSSLLIEIIEALIAGGIFPAKARKIYAHYNNQKNRQNKVDQPLGWLLYFHLLFLLGTAVLPFSQKAFRRVF